MSHDPRRIDILDLVICRTQKGHRGWLVPHKGPPPPPPATSRPQKWDTRINLHWGGLGIGVQPMWPSWTSVSREDPLRNSQQFSLGDVREHGSLCCRGDLGAFSRTIPGAASQLKMFRFLAASTWSPSSSIGKYSGCQEGPLCTFDWSSRRAQGGQNR